MKLTKFFTSRFNVGKSVFGFLFVCAVLAFTACDDGGGGGGGGFVDDHNVNSILFGTWKMTYEGGYDQYVINATTTVHTDTYGTNATGFIYYVYNFSNTAGALIVKYNEGSKLMSGPVGTKYSAIYFDIVNNNAVKLGDAYGSAPDYTEPAVTTLEAAIEKFKPSNAALYGGGDALQGSPMIKQP